MEELYRGSGGSSRKDFVEKFTKLSWIGTVLDYLEHFEHLRSFMYADNPTLSEKNSYPHLSITLSHNYSPC